MLVGYILSRVCPIDSMMITSVETFSAGVLDKNKEQ